MQLARPTTPAPTSEIVKGDLPEKTDKDPSWRATAIYTREEVEQLIADVRIPEDRRVLYALKSLASLRHSEAAELTWRQYDQTSTHSGVSRRETCGMRQHRRAAAQAAETRARHRCTGKIADRWAARQDGHR